MLIDKVLSRLEKVKARTGERWLCRCPAHDDRRPSLSVGYEDGKILIHCFAGCAPDDVLAAIGLEFQDLFEKTPDHTGNYKRVERHRGFTASDALRALEIETRIVGIFAGDISAGVTPSKEDVERVKLASLRIEAGAQFVRALNEYRK